MSFVLKNGRPLARPLITSAAVLFGVQDPVISVNGTGIEPWSTIQPFLDISKKMSSWDSSSGNVDWMIANGYVDAGTSWITAATLPTGFYKTINVQDGDDYFNGKQFRMQWTGAGSMSAPVGATVDSSAANEIVFTLPADLSGGDIAVTATSGPISGLTIVETNKTARYDAGQRVNPDYSAIIADVREIRFMDWNHTNGNDQTNWASRPVLSQNSYSKDGNGSNLINKAGVPIEIMVEVCNRIKADMWFCFPHAATDDYITNVATYIRDNLNPDLKCTFELSNEVWNFNFTVQRAHFEALGGTLWPDAVGVASSDDITLSAHGFRSWQMSGLVDAVYSGITSRRKLAFNVQTSWVIRSRVMLDAPVWQTYAGNGNSTSGPYSAPYSTHTHIAVTSYFGGGLLDDGRDTIIEAAYPATSDTVIDNYLREPGTTSGTDGWDVGALAAVGQTWSDWNAECIARGMKMIQYEGGPHIVQGGGQSQTSRDAVEQWLRGSLGAAYMTDLIDRWDDFSEAEGPFQQFQDVGHWSAHGFWTFQENMNDAPQGYMAQLFAENSARGNWWGDTADYRHGAL